MDEYYRFIVLLRDNPDVMVPSTVVLHVWQVHFEYYKDYTLLIIRLFSKILYPEDYAMRDNPSDKWKENYR